MASPDSSPAAEEPSTIIDDLHYSLQAEQKNTQKRTFTSWVNSQLEKHSPPSVVSDLYTDIGKGNILLDLLEVLSGQQLPREKGSNTFQCRSNIEHALTFLKNRSIKLINIHVADIIEGKPSIVLGLIWSIILHFHIEELAWTLTCVYGHRPVGSPSAVSAPTTANPSAKTNATIKERWKMSAKKALLLWAKEQCAIHGSISVADFKSSWRNGLAFLAVIHALRPDLVDMEQAKGRSNKENLKEAFDIAEKELNIPRLLEPEDVDVVSPDEKSIMTYVSQFLQYFKSLPVPEEEMKGKVNETLSWLNAQEEKFEKLLSETEHTPFCKKFQEMLSFMETFNEEKKAFLPILASKRNTAEMSDGYPRIREAWDNLTSQMNEWIAKLHCSLPSPLDAIESWLQETELQLAEDLPDSHDHSKAVAILEGKVESLKSLMECSERHLETLQSFKNRDGEGKPLVPHRKLEEMRRRLSNVQLVDFNILVEYQHSVCSAILEELTSKLNIWHIKYGNKESVESLLSDWQVFITEKGFLAQLENIFQVCEEKKNKIIKASNLGANPQDVTKLFLMVESKIGKCREYIYNVNETLRKVLSSWITYRENVNLLAAWLEETRKARSEDVPPETLATWNSRHGSLNEAGNFLIECCNEDVGSAVFAELKKLNRKWAKLIKKTQFEMRMLQMQGGDLKLMTDSNGNVKSLNAATSGPLGCPADTSEETLRALMENVKTTPVSLDTDLLTHGRELVSEQEAKLNFEEAQKVLEASVLNAMQLLGQEMQLKGPVSKYEETLSILDAKILGRFLKAAGQLKAVLPVHEKAAAEERSKDVCERWKAVRREIVSYIHLKMEMEREKLNQIFSKLNEQINKEKKLLTMGKTKGLMEEHEATFSQHGSLGELNTCLEALKSMSEKMSEEEKQLGTKTSVEEYEKQREELQARASDVYSALMSQTKAGHSSEKEGFALVSANGDKASALNLCDNVSAKRNPQDGSGKPTEPEVKFQNGDHSAEKTGKDGDLPLKTLKESYHTAKHNLKLHLHNIRENVASGFADDPKDASCLQKKLHELEILDNKGDFSWKHFESMALNLEKFASESEKPVVSDKAREELLKEWNMLRLALSERIASLKAVLGVIVTAENEWLRLQTLNEQLRKTEIPQCVLTNTESAFKRLKEIQESVARCVEQCNRLEQGRLPGCQIVPVDQQAAEVVTAEYKVLLEELGRKIQVIETILQDLRSFLASLRLFKESTATSADASTAQSPPQQVGLMKISLLTKKAKSLDERLKQVNIDLENAERGPKMCCEKMVSALVVKDKPEGSAEEQKDIPTCEAQEEFTWENSELLKNIQDIQEKINKVGLKDPTIPAVQQRSKSLSELRQKLDRLVAELKTLKGTAGQLQQLSGVKGEEMYQQWRVTEDLWKGAKHSIAERQDVCARVIELLKQYHSCKNGLESVIQKQEHVLSQQASYMGKDNLQRIIANVNMVKSEFGNHSEDVDKINQICKNLQMQLNKMKSFEEPPFENEANAIVDRWLDINERTENYCDNLGRALALWDKLLNFSSSIDGWLNTELKKVDNQRLTEEELAELEVGLRFQEENLEEFDRKVDEIQGLLNGTEPPLELQVIKSSLLNKMELVRKHLSNKLIPAELNGNSAELKEDLDLAKTQIGMTESLLKALSPSDTLEIFTKLEEIHQKILQQKCHVKLLQKETGCMSPEVIELKKQLKSVTDLFTSKKQIFQDHFTTLLNYQCEDFNDWFNSTRQSLKECSDPSETREELEEKIQRLVSFLTFEGKHSDICEVKTLLAKVKSYLPKANVSQLSSWVKDQEEELEKLTFQCRAQEKELGALAKRFTRLEEEFSRLEKCLSLQEEKLQKSHMKKAERAQFYRLLLKQSESVNSLAWLTDWFMKSGFSSDELVQESAQIVNRHKVLLSQVQKSLGASQVRSADEKNFEDLAQSMLSWVQSLKELLLGLSSEEPKMPLEGRLHQVKEIISMKEEGDAKLQNIVTLEEHLKSKDGNKNLATQQMLSDIRNQWECTVHLADEYLRHQEQLQHQKEQERQKEGNIRAALSKLGKQKQEFGLGRQPGFQERQSQSPNDTELLLEVEGLTSLLNELKGWQNTLEDGTGSPSAEESLVTLQHLHEGLLHQLQIITELLEGCTEEQLQCEKLMRCLRTTLKEILKPMNTTQKQVQQIPCYLTQDTLQEIGALVESIKKKILPLECKPKKKDVVDTPQPKPRKRFKYQLGSVEKETGNVHSNILKFSDEMQTSVTGNGTTETGKLESSDVSLAAEKISFVDLPVAQKRKSEKFQRLKIKTDRESPKLFQEWLVTEEQPCSMSAESEDGPASDLEGLKDSLMESHNFQSSTSQTGKTLKTSSEQIPADDNLPDGLQERQLGDKKELEAVGGGSEMPPTTLPLMKGKVMGADLTALSVTHPSLQCQVSEMEIVSQTALVPEDQTPVEYTEIEQKVDKVKNQAAELDIALLKNQLQEIENLCAQLEEKKAKDSLFCPNEPATVAERSQSSLPDAHGAVSCWDGLLQDLRAMKQAKEDQCRLVNNYQECLSAVQSSMKHLSVEKESIKTKGPMQVTVLLKNIEKCLASIQREKMLLNKLNAEQENLSKHLTFMDKELTQSQVKQVKQLWEHIQDFLQRKHLRVAEEVDEFKSLMEKAQKLQKLLQQQHCLQTGLDAPKGETQVHLALLATELQALKHRLSLLKRDSEMRMKRLWSDPDKKTLESALNDLQSQVEELEQLTPKEEVLITAHDPQAYEIARRTEEAILWVRVLLLHLDEKPALFPDDLALQIENCQAAVGAVEKKEQDVVQLVDEAQQIALQLGSSDASTLKALSQELQTRYRDLVLKIAQRLQQLESHLKKRQKLFADVGKIETQLGDLEGASNSDTSNATLKSELDHWQAVLEEISKVVRGVEGVIDATSSQQFNIFEQLFLNDYLRSLINRGKRVQRLIQIKCFMVKNKIEVCAKLSEMIMELDQELKDLQCKEMKLDSEKLLQVDREVEDQLGPLKERAKALQSSLSYLHKHKEMWGCQELKWDVSGLEELQRQLGQVKENLELRVKCFDDAGAEYNRCQMALSKAETIITALQRDCDALKDGLGNATETSLLSAKSWNQKLQLARDLVQEALRLLDTNEAFGASLKEAKRKQLKGLEGKIDGLAQIIQRKISTLQAQYRHDEGFQRRLDLNLQALKQIRFQLQQPLLVGLEIHTVSYEKMYCQVLEDAAEGEFCTVEALINEEKGALGRKSAFTNDLDKELDKVQKLKIQMKADIAARRSALDEAYEIVELYNEAVQKATDLFGQCEAHLSSPLLSLDELEDAGQLSHAKQEEFEAAKAEVEVLTSTLENKIKSEAKPQLEKTLCDLGAKSLIVTKQVQKRKSDVQSFLEHYQSFTGSREKIHADLKDVEKVLWKYLGSTPLSYKEALEQSERSKMLTSQLVSTEEDLKKLRQDVGHLSLLCREKDCVLLDTIVSTLWLKWLRLLEAAREWESKCEEQNQEWKTVSEEMERETIILDNLQEEVPENPKEKEGATKEELQEFLECVGYCEESVNAEKLLLRLILHRIRSILNVPECPSEEGGDLPLMSEIQAMQERLKELSQKAQKQKDAVLLEMQERAETSNEIDALMKSLQGTISLLHQLNLEAHTEKAGKLEEIQRTTDSQKQALEQIMDKLRMKYSEMYTIVPVEIETHLEDCKQTLKDLEEKVGTEILNSPRYTTDKKIEDINKGLQAIESMLQQKTENMAKAKEIQQRIWDLLDLWHYKMNELDSEVQDTVEQDPCQGQELMDRLMVPLQKYQQVSQRAERRTASINRASSKLEECDELLKSTHVWLENTGRLLTEEAKSDTAKALNKHADALQMALEDSEQKQSILSAIYPELEEFSTLIETENKVQELNHMNEQVTALQQKIMDVLPHIQHLADEVEAIECEVKSMEKNINKIKTILSPSEDALDFSPKEHLKHGQVILAHISPMQKGLLEIQSYQESLRLPDVKIQPFSVFQRTKQLLKELKTLEIITKEQNKLLEPIVKEVEESEHQMDTLKQVLKTHLDGFPIETPRFTASYPEDEKMEKIKQQIEQLCQKKEDILTTMKNSLLELHLRQEESESDDEILESQVPKESGGGSEWQPQKRGSLSLLPSLVEEAEDSSFHSEGESSTPVTSAVEGLWRIRGDSNETLDPERTAPEAAQVLHACQAQVAELELWLDQAQESLRSAAQTRQMQQALEQHLVECQLMLSEIEQKVTSLLDRDRLGLQGEAESLSLKLKDVKCNLEKVQGMLQDKSTEEQLNSDKIRESPLKTLTFTLPNGFPVATSDQPLLSSSKGLQQQQELLLKLSEQNNLIDFIEVYVATMQPRTGDNTILDLQASPETPVSVSEFRGPVPSDQAGDKWQHLQEELLFKMNSPHCQFVKPQIATKINILPKGASSSVRTPTVEELKAYTAQLGSLSQEASIQIQENMTGEGSLNLDQKLFELLLAISRCLSNMEQMLNTCVLTSDEAPVQQVLYETLSAELQTLHKDIGDKKVDLLKSITVAGGNADRFSQCFSSLQAWLQLTQAAAASRSESMKMELDRHSSYQNEIRLLYDVLIEEKSSLQQSFGARGRDGVPDHLQNIDSFEVELQNFEMQVAKLRDRGERLNLPVSAVQEVYKLEDMLDDLWGMLRAKQKELTTPFVAEHQYEALLKGLEELVRIGQEKVTQVPKLKPASQQELEFLLQNHKDFFQNLRTHMLATQMCSQRVAPSFSQKKETFWNKLVEKVKSLEEQAVQYGTHLERLLQDWIEFDEIYGSFLQKLEATSSAVPSVGLVEETEERLLERIGLLQQIKRSTEEEQARYQQVTAEGKKVVALVNCPELESQIEKLEGQWESLCTKVDHELQRLETMLRLLSSYNRDSKELEKWLESAQQRVNDWKEQSLSASQDLDTVRSSICSLLAFSKEVDHRSSLKSSVISTGNQLLLIKACDTATLRTFLAELEQKWADLIAQLPSIQEKFHQLQMAKLASHEAITELTAWMDHVDQQRREEAAVSPQSPGHQLKDLLKKYREYLMEMNFKQWMVDYVNQSLLQMTTCDVESKRYERTMFAERLGEMNLQWHQLQGSLKEKIKELEHLLESVSENENRAQSLNSWLEAQSSWLKLMKKPASFILAQKRVEDCEALENQLAIKSGEVNELKQNYTASVDCARASAETASGINELDEMKTKVDNQVAQLKTSTLSALEKWEIYGEAWEEVRLMLARALYCMELNKPLVITVEALRSQVENLQLLQDKAESSEESWTRLQAAADDLKELCDPSCSEIIEQKYKEAHKRWTQMNEEIGEQLKKAQSSLSLLESFVDLRAKMAAELDKYEEQSHSLLVAKIPSSRTMDFLKEKLQDVQKLQHSLQNIKGSFHEISELADKIAQLTETATHSLLLEKMQPLERVSCLEKMLQMKADEFQFELLQLEDFENCLEKLEKCVKESSDVLDHRGQGDEDSDQLLNDTLSLTALSPEMESLNEVSFRIPLNDCTTKRLQDLNWRWTQRTAMALERCSELQGIQSDEKKFLQKCQNWVQFLEKAKEDLKKEVPGTLEKLQEQQKQHEVLQAEISINQQIFNTILSKALHMLESGEAENRTEFISKLTLLKEQWQSIIQVAQQRKAEIDGLVKQWQKFRNLLQDLTKFLMDTDNFVAAVKSQEKYSLHQARTLSHSLKNKEILLQRWQTRYSLTLDIGETLVGLADPEAKTGIQVEISGLREKWDNTQLQVEKVSKQLQSTIQMWESCEKQVEDLGQKLQELKARIEDPLPVEDDDLHTTKEHVKELEKSLANWDQNLKELGSMKADLAHYILAEDMLVLKEQVAHLHRQWEELCLRVSLRKQEIEDRLNTWIGFNEKNKELCAWLVQMESKVLQSADVSIEDMIEKLQKDCMEEINLFSENKLAHLKQMGEQLIKASNKCRVTEIDEKLNKIDSRWQHLFDVIGGRVKKLKETLGFIQQLDKKMSNLRTWLARIESELSKPVVYDICDDQEIQKRLAEQQDLQRDIEQHSAGVESVFNICEVLLHDSDACANETECDSIQQTTRSLDRRWRNICAMSMERRMKIEETWRLWQKFLDDYSRFEDWLKMAERTAAYPNSSEVSYTNAKEELKKFEAFQRQIHERLTQLELINKQYRRLARENRTDSASKLKQMVHEGNQRWDNLQKRVAAILRRLKHFTNQWEEFVGTKDSILVWLTEMDLQLTNVEHFSESNLDDKMRQLNGFQQEITLNTNKIDQLIVFGENLIQKCEPSDAVVIEEELEELHKYCQDVFGRVSRFHQRLTFWHPGLEDEKESSENEADSEDVRGVQNDPWHKKTMPDVPPSQQSLCHLMPPAMGHERSGCETPVSIDSIPLEWDHTGDVGGSSSHEDEEEEPYFSALSGKSASDSHAWHSPDSSICRKHLFNQGEVVSGNRDVLSSSPAMSTPYKPGYVKQLSNSSVGSMKEISRILPGEEAPDSPSLASIASVKKQPGVIESQRWDLIQAQDLSNKLRMKQNLQQWQQLNADLTNISAWLDKIEGDLEELQEAEPASSIQDLEQRVKKLKDMLKAFDNYKALALSVNLTSKDFKQADNTESKELQNRLRRVNLRWEKANLLMGNWRKSLQEALIHCQDFHELNQKLLLWLAGAETRRHQAQVKDLNADPHAIQESRKELMQLEKELLEKQLQVNTLQEIATHLLVRSHGRDYAEADEKVHVIGKKLKQLLEGVSHDLKVLQGRQDLGAFLSDTDGLNSEGYYQLPENACMYTNKAAGRKTLGSTSTTNISTEDMDEAQPVTPKTRSFFRRVLRAALPLQLLFLLLLFFISMIPFSEEDYSCTQANNFARSFYPMLRYMNGPPPT